MILFGFYLFIWKNCTLFYTHFLYFFVLFCLVRGEVNWCHTHCVSVSKSLFYFRIWERRCSRDFCERPAAYSSNCSTTVLTQADGNKCIIVHLVIVASSFFIHNAEWTPLHIHLYDRLYHLNVQIENRYIMARDAPIDRLVTGIGLFSPWPVTGQSVSYIVFFHGVPHTQLHRQYSHTHNMLSSAWMKTTQSSQSVMNVRNNKLN